MAKRYIDDILEELANNLTTHRLIFLHAATFKYYRPNDIPFIDEPMSVCISISDMPGYRRYEIYS